MNQLRYRLVRSPLRIAPKYGVFLGVGMLALLASFFVPVKWIAMAIFALVAAKWLAEAVWGILVLLTGLLCGICGTALLVLADFLDWVRNFLATHGKTANVQHRN